LFFSVHCLGLHLVVVILIFVFFDQFIPVLGTALRWDQRAAIRLLPLLVPLLGGGSAPVDRLLRDVREFDCVGLGWLLGFADSDEAATRVNDALRNFSEVLVNVEERDLVCFLRNVDFFLLRQVLDHFLKRDCL